jgi:hypothetical protein
LCFCLQNRTAEEQEEFTQKRKDRNVAHREKKRAKTAADELEFSNKLRPRAKNPDADRRWTDPEVTAKAADAWIRPDVRRIVVDENAALYIFFTSQKRCTLALEAIR